MPSCPPPSAPGAASALRVGFAGSIGRCCFGDLLLRGDPGLEAAFSTGSRKGLLAALAAGEIDAAVYPGPPASRLPSAVLCDDRLVVAAAPHHPLAGSRRVSARALSAWPVLLPAEGDGGELRRLARALVPDLDLGEELAPRDLARRLAGGGAVAVACAGQADELGHGLTLLELAEPRVSFEVRIAWTPAAAAGLFGRLLPQLGV